MTVHAFQMVYYGPLGVALEALLPLGLAVLVALAGPWLHRRGYASGERGRMLAWMALVAVLVGLLYAWTLSHQLVLGYRFPHAGFVMTTNLIAGSLRASSSPSTTSPPGGAGGPSRPSARRWLASASGSPSSTGCSGTTSGTT